MERLHSVLLLVTYPYRRHVITHSIFQLTWRFRWEVVELVRKLILSSILLLMDRGSPWQVAAAAIASVCFHNAYTRFNPMADRRARAL